MSEAADRGVDAKPRVYVFNRDGKFTDGDELADVLELRAVVRSANDLNFLSAQRVNH
jgi:hypothetical protein